MNASRAAALVALQEADKALNLAQAAVRELGENEIAIDLIQILEDVNDIAAYLVERREGRKPEAAAVAS